ncbi:MAG: FIMAH domain-containing protein [Gemmatimonadota bacterium]
MGACSDESQPAAPSGVESNAGASSDATLCEGEETNAARVSCAFGELSDLVDESEADGDLEPGHARALQNKVRSAEKQATKDNLEAARSILLAFERQVAAFERSSHLESEIATDLQEIAAFIRSRLGEDDDPAALIDRIVFASNRGGDFDVFAMGTDGSDPTPIAPEAGSDDLAPVVSPEGTRIVFRSNRGGGDDLFTMNADGSEVERLTDDAAGESAGAWSPDGGRIAFGSDRAGDPDIYVVDADGSGLTRLTDDAAATNDDPAWSPDGTRIAFMSDRSGDLTGDVWLMDADGTDQVRLTTTDGVDDGPAWFPDGTRIAFRSNRDGQYEIYTAPADGSGAPVRLTNDAAQDFSPDWSPTGDAP